MSEDDTPVPPHRRSTGNITSWGIVSVWLSDDPARRVELLVGPQGLCVHVLKEGGSWVIELVAPHEDPSAAAMRGIGKL